MIGSVPGGGRYDGWSGSTGSVRRTGTDMGGWRWAVGGWRRREDSEVSFGVRWETIGLK